MIEEVAANIYRIVVPLPIAFLDSVNVYVVKDRDRSLIIDTGMPRQACADMVRAGLSEIGVTPAKADIFITHYHGDHFGLVSNLIDDESIVYIDAAEISQIECITSGRILTDMVHFLRITGFPEKDPTKIIPPDIGEEYRARDNWPFRRISDGEVLERGGYHLTCIRTPGHSRGHTCLYEAEHKILFAGDHILADITPGIQLRSDNEDPLADYAASLTAIGRLDVAIVLPGHRAPFHNCRERINELLFHHEERVTEVLTALRDGSKDAYQAASVMPWSIIDCEGWDAVPIVQKLFATGEAFAHLKYMEGRGQIRKHLDGERLIYSLPE